MKTVAVTPIIGEFGYIVFDIQPRVRSWLRSSKADRRVVFAPQELGLLFEDATEIISPPPELLPTAPATGRSIVYEYWDPTNPERIKIDRLIQWARDTVKADEWLEIPYFLRNMWTAPATFTRLQATSKVPLPTEPYIVIAARSRDFDCWRNWPAASWDELVRRIRDSWGVGVHAIGRPPSTIYPQGSIPQDVAEDERLAHSIALLNGAICSVTSNSGPTHLSLMAGCPTFAWGEPYLKQFMESYTNPLKAPCNFLSAGWDPDVDLVWSALVKWKSSLESTGVWNKPRNKRGVSMCMIARDSSRTIAAALDSIRPWVDEMVVLDTGSTDDTPQIAERCGAKVFRAQWQDSFSIARNTSIREATHEWVIWIDSDDTIDEANGRKLRALVEATHSPSVMGFVLQVRCPADPSTNGYATATVVDHVKLFRNIQAIQFSGRIHEQVLPSIRLLGGDVEWADISVEHSGSEHSETARATKHRRDIRLLELSLAEEPDNTFHLFNMGMTLLDAARAEESLNFLCRSLQMVTAGESHTRKLFAFLTQAYTTLGRIDSALKSCQQGLGVFPDDPELLFRKSSLEQLSGRFEDAEQTLTKLLDAKATGRFFSSRDDGIVGIKAWHNLAIIYEKTGRDRLAVSAWEKVVACTPNNPEAVRGLLDSLTSCQDVAKLEALRDRPGIPQKYVLMTKSRLLVFEGRPRDAVRELESHLNDNPDTELLDEICRIAFEGHNLERAEYWLRKLVIVRPDDPSAQLNLGTVFLKRHNYLKAANCARRSLELRPNHPGAADVLRQATERLALAGTESAGL